MFDFNAIIEFSCNYCVAICAFLVPANLIATGATLLLLFFHKPKTQLRITTALASIAATALFLHITTWFLIGVITPVTFILLTLGSTCLAINCWAMIHPKSGEQLQKLVNLIIKEILKLNMLKKNVFTN